MKASLGCYTPHYRKKRMVSRWRSMEERMCMGLTSAEKRLKVRAERNKTNQRAHQDFHNVITVRRYLNNYRCLTWETLEKLWDKSESKNARPTPRGRSRSHVPLLTLYAPLERRCGIYWYCGLFPRGVYLRKISTSQDMDCVLNKLCMLMRKTSWSCTDKIDYKSCVNKLLNKECQKWW